MSCTVAETFWTVAGAKGQHQGIGRVAGEFVMRVYGQFGCAYPGKKPMWKVLSEERSLHDLNCAKHVLALAKMECALCTSRRGLRAYYLHGGPAAPQQGVASRTLDCWAIPACVVCAARLARIGPKREEEFCRTAAGINCYALARELFAKRRDKVAMASVLLSHKVMGLAALGRVQGCAREGFRPRKTLEPLADAYRQRGRERSALGGSLPDPA